MHDNADYVVSPGIAEKALRLVDDHRVELMAQASAYVSGDSGFHAVLAQDDRVWCDCAAWRPDRLCSHAVAAMIVWADA